MRESRSRSAGGASAHALSAGAYITELKIPAIPDYIVVAKRTAASLGVVVGFSLHEIDDLNIAITQACENACHTATEQWGSGNGQLKLLYKSQPRRLEVEVRSIPPRDLELQTVRRVRRTAEYDYESIGLNMIRLFVDELRYQVNNQTGSTRVRMVKYLIE